MAKELKLDLFKIELFKIVDDMDRRLIIARNQGVSVYEVKKEIRDELLEFYNRLGGKAEK